MIETILQSSRIGSPETVYKDHVRHVYRVVAEFNSFAKEYYVSDNGQRAGVIVVRQKEVLLVRQYLLLINGLGLEVPGGKVDDGKTLEVAAMRECQKETGVRCSGLNHLLNYYPGLDVSQNHTHIFYTNEFIELPQVNPERRVWLPLARCVEMVLSGEILDGMSIIALLAYYVHRNRREQ